MAALLSQRVTPATNTTPTTPAPDQSSQSVRTDVSWLPAPERYDGHPDKCRGFLSQCSLHFAQRSSVYTTDQSRVTFIISLSSGDALACGSALWEEQTPLCCDYLGFVQEFKHVFDHPMKARHAAKRLLRIRQEQSLVSAYAVEFRNLTIEAKWSETALVPVFLEGLYSNLQSELAIQPPSATLKEAVDLALSR